MKNLQLKITALIFGIAIWFYAISLQDFQLTMEVPLTFARIPDVLAIASKPPKTISIQVTGNVFDLIRMRYKKGTPAAIVIDAQHVEQGWTHFTINAENFSAPDFPEIEYVVGDRLRTVDVEFDTRIRRKVPVKLAAEFEEAPGYTFVTVPTIEPAEILFSGARTALIPLEYVSTSAELFKNISENGIYKLPINLETLPAYVSTEDSIVQVHVTVQPIATTTFEKIPVHLIGMYDKQKYTLEPSQAKVEITGGKEILASIDPDELDIFIEYNRFAIENAEELAPSHRIGKNIKGIQIYPDKFKLVEKAKPAEAEPEKVEEVAAEKTAEVPQEVKEQPKTEVPKDSTKEVKKEAAKTKQKKAKQKKAVAEQPAEIPQTEAAQ